MRLSRYYIYIYCIFSTFIPLLLKAGNRLLHSEKVSFLVFLSPDVTSHYCASFAAQSLLLLKFKSTKITIS